MYGAMLLLHLLAAAIWTGGHLVLACSVLPQCLRRRDAGRLLQFEADYEWLGMGALLTQVGTGVWLAYHRLPDFGQWLALGNPAARPIAAKLVLLAVTAAFAADARLRVIPRLTERNLASLAWHVYAVTAASVLFVVAGVSFRTGWLY